MNTRFFGVVALATATLSGGIASPARAGLFDISNVRGTWTDVSGTEIFSGTGTGSVRWGLPASSSGQSGLEFAASADASVDVGTSFVLGRLTHVNLPTFTNTAASGASWQLSMDIDNVTQAFDYEFEIDETTNGATCPLFQISATPCDDRIIFSSALSSTTFVKENVSYTLELLGFSSSEDGLSPTSSFITEENRRSDGFLVARVTRDPRSEEPTVTGDPRPEEPISTPEPIAATGLLLVGLAGLKLRRSR